MIHLCRLLQCITSFTNFMQVSVQMTLNAVVSWIVPYRWINNLIHGFYSACDEMGETHRRNEPLIHG